MIIVDSRETKCIKLLQSRTVDLKKEFLEVGDYLLPDSTGVERKKGKDTLASITDKRFYTQMINLCQYSHPILAIISDNIWKDMYFSKSRWIHSAYDGALYTIYAKFPKVRVLFFKTDEEFVDFLIALDKKLMSDTKGERPILLSRKATTIKEVKENCLAQIPGVGLKMSKKLLKKYHSIHSIAEADEKDMLTIDKLGKKTIINIKEALN